MRAFLCVLALFCCLSFREILQSCSNCAKQAEHEAYYSGHKEDACFVTVQMAANGDFLEPIQNLTAIGIRLPRFRYIVITNDERLDTKDWEKVVVKLDTRQYIRVKTHVTYGKFLAWKEPALNTCRVIFVMDALNVPVNNASVWQDLERRIHDSPGGLIAQLKADNKTNLDHLMKLPEMKKDTRESVQQTRDWLLSRPTYRTSTLCLWTNFFGYDPTNPLYRAASEEFWTYYSTEMLSARDQPLWSYAVDKWNLQPSYVWTVPPHQVERRPHVHVCAEKDRILCQEGVLTNHKKCEDAASRFQHELINVQNVSAINCEKRKGGHKMSVLNKFVD